MKNMLRHMLKEVVQIKRATRVGNELAFGLVDMGYVSPNTDDQVEVIEEIASAFLFQWKRIKRQERINSRMNGGFDAALFFRAFGDEDKEALYTDINMLIQDHCSYICPSVDYSLVGPSISDALKDVPEDVQIKQLYAYVFAWDKINPDKFEMFIIPVNTHIKDMMQRQMVLDDYSELRND